ncbi:hypothetical protein CsatA_024286 [Cannabis sativa]
MDLFTTWVAIGRHVRKENGMNVPTYLVKFMNLPLPLPLPLTSYSKKLNSNKKSCNEIVMIMSFRLGKNNKIYIGILINYCIYFKLQQAIN